MADRWQTARAHIMTAEGGYVDDPKDLGGATNFGISLRFLQAEGRLDANRDGHPDGDLDFDGDIDKADIRKLTRDQAADLYKRCFWDRYRCAEMPERLDIAFFDQAVNGGAGAATKCLQKAINQTLHAQRVAVDGDLGRETRKALVEVMNAGKSGALITAFRAFVESRYRDIVRLNPSQARFLNGWVNRARNLGNV